MAEFEIGGMTFKGGKMFVALTALSTLGGSAWAGFEFYKDYTDMAEVVANIDVNKIEERNKLIESKLDAAIEYTRDIKGGLREDILSIEKQADRVEDDVRESEDRIRTTIQNAEERFENKPFIFCKSKFDCNINSSKELRELPFRIIGLNIFHFFDVISTFSLCNISTTSKSLLNLVMETSSKNSLLTLRALIMFMLSFISSLIQRPFSVITAKYLLSSE